MPASSSELVATIRSWSKCVNEKRWEDLPKYMHSTYNQNGIDYTPESWATHIREHVAPQLGGDVRINEDSIMVDDDAQCIAFSMWLKFKPDMPFLGYQPKGKDVLLVEHGFIWFTDGKLSKGLFLMNNDDLRKQLSSPNAEFAPSLISEYAAPKVETRLTREELEKVYRAYVDAFNERRTATEYAKFVHQPDKAQNNGISARRVMEETLAAMPDLHVEIETLIADEDLQRVAVWLKFTGTPMKEFAGLLATGRPVRFTEHATYQYLNGKIQRIWGVMDLDEAREQQQESPKPRAVSVL
ncbi:hypothetical protein M426DRAFT_10964 [Hypoxylon sp. CI-4A]|nr:hypothetical protein M426DRAFT_10964 [Hypoxylon sp. CI-4A]